MGFDPITAALVGGAIGLVSSGGDIKSALTGAALSGLGAWGLGELGVGASLAPEAASVGSGVATGASSLGGSLAGAGLTDLAMTGATALGEGVSAGLGASFFAPAATTSVSNALPTWMGGQLGSGLAFQSTVPSFMAAGAPSVGGLSSLAGATAQGALAGASGYAPVFDALQMPVDPSSWVEPTLWESVQSNVGGLANIAKQGSQTGIAKALRGAGALSNLYDTYQGMEQREDMYNRQKQMMDARLAAYNAGGQQQGSGFSPLQSFGLNNFRSVRGAY